MKNFVIIGASGFIAPRHMNAIKETKNNLVAAIDPSDSIGIIDTYFPEAKFFKDLKKFETFYEGIKKENIKIDYFSICSPNYLHESHIKYALNKNSNVICEKPLLLNTNALEEIENISKKKNKTVYTILQLRYHPNIIKLKNEVLRQKKLYNIELTYITLRGSWYQNSWKGLEPKSGGILMNIGIHFFDLLIWVFGDVVDIKLHTLSKDLACGTLEFKKAKVQWFLSINGNYLPKKLKSKNIRTLRSIVVNNKKISLDYNFENLHSLCYKNIFNQRGFGPKDCYKSIEIVSRIKNLPMNKNLEKFHHPMIKSLLT